MEEPNVYRGYAEECRRIARGLPPEQRDRLLAVAAAWDECAEEAEARKQKRGE
jgi:hypothetical protein